MTTKLSKTILTFLKRNSILKHESLQIYPEEVAKPATITNNKHGIMSQDQFKNKIQNLKRTKKSILT